MTVDETKVQQERLDKYNAIEKIKNIQEQLKANVIKNFDEFYTRTIELSYYNQIENETKEVIKDDILKGINETFDIQLKFLIIQQEKI